MAARLGWDTPALERAVPGPWGRWFLFVEGRRLVVRCGARLELDGWTRGRGVLLLLAVAMRRSGGHVGAVWPYLAMINSNHTKCVSGEIENTVSKREDLHCKYVLRRKTERKDQPARNMLPSSKMCMLFF